jgi:WS/DGAT/MGAT family acyltransferase
MAQFLRNTDAFVWSIEGDPRLRSTIVTLVLLDRSPDWSELVNRFDLISRSLPAFRQHVVRSPAPAPPRWEADPDFDLAFHVRRVSAAEPASIETLLEMARIAAMADFDRARPLWEVTLVDGLADGGAALLCRLHHSLSDGIGAVDIARILFDETADYRRCSPPPASSPSAVGRLALIRDSVIHEAGLAGGALWASVKSAPGLLANGILHPIGSGAGLAAVVASVVRTARPIRQPGSPIMVRRTRVRRLAVHDVPKARLQMAGTAGGGSLNDAFIAAVVGGLCRYHEKHATSAGHFTVTMPVSIRTATDPVGGNRATLMRFNVSAANGDPAHRVRAIHQHTSRLRAEKSLAYTQLIAAGLNLAPRWYVGSALRSVDVVASDVPGFQKPVFLAGAAVRRQYAFSPTIGAALNVTLLSYVDTCAIGINVDSGAIPDLDSLYDCLVAGFDEILALAD